MVFSAASLTHAGQPSAVGGSIVRAFGWATLLVGLMIALAIGAFLALFSPTVGLVVGGFLGFVALTAFLLLNKGGKSLEAQGQKTRENRREQALEALAYNRGGVLQAAEAASALDLSVDEADGFLTHLAKQHPDLVGVDVGEQGEVFYTFFKVVPVGAVPLAGRGIFSGARVRVEAGPPVVSSAPTPRPPIDPKVIDAEFEAIEEGNAAAAEKKRTVR